jgi:glycosyltransferase involved in cell wall biosynthesis
MRPAIVAVHAESVEQRERAGRTRRALAGWPLSDTSAAPLRAAADQLGSGPVWLIRAGAWPRIPIGATLPWPLPSHTGAPLCALGAVCPAPGAPALSREAGAWLDLLRSTGGELSRVTRGGRAALPAASVYLDAVLAPLVFGRVGRGEPLDIALAATLRDRRARVVRHALLDVFDDSALRVAQVVTSVQQGGAERVSIDLATELPRLGVRARVFALYAARRAALPCPSDTIEIAALAPAASELELIDRMAHELSAWGADVAHTHLLDARQLERLAARGHRSLVTVHNTAASWPAGMRGLPGDAATLLVACAHAVESELEAHAPATPRRTVWNGIRPALPGATGWRERLGVPEQALVLLAIANPRPQKRLELLPAIARASEAALAAAGDARPVHLVIAGSTKPVPAAAAEALGALEREICRHALGARVHLPGSVDDVAGLLAAADVLVSPSAHEGLSLAHLEALAAGVPVVASGAGGTRELAELTSSLVHLPLDAPPEAFAHAALAARCSRAPDGPRVVREYFGAERMARAYARLYPRALARSRPAERDGLLLVSNNFSIGGAQSSARQLLLALRARGERVRAVVIEEQPEHPTPGRRALEARGVPVLALPPPAELPARDAVPRLVAAIERDPPRAVLLWNVIVEHKLRLAESLLDIPLFDVSPGEMYFASLRRYFAAPSRELPYRTARDYGARLAGVAVKYEAEVELARATLGLEARVIPNGVSLVPRSARSPTDRLVIGTAARLHPDKRLGDLLEALRRAAPRLPPHVLRIAGGVDGASHAHALELRERGRGLSVEWLGELDDPGAFFAGLDVFALVAEPAGCPNASLEAMAHGLPVVATAVGGMSEQIALGAGLLVPRRDPAAFADALVELAASPERRAALGRAGCERVRRLFSTELMVERYAELCGLVAAAPAARVPLVRQTANGSGERQAGRAVS